MNVEKAAIGMLDHLTGRGQQVGGLRLRVAVNVQGRDTAAETVELIVDLGDQRFVFEGREDRAPDDDNGQGDDDDQGERGGREGGRREPA